MVAFLHLLMLLSLASGTLCGGLILAGLLPAPDGDLAAPAAAHAPPAVARLGFAAQWLDLAPQLTEAVRQAAPAAALRGVGLATAMEPGLALRTDRAALHAALAAVLDQAISVAAGGQVLLTARRDGWVIELAVLDDGPGADPAGRHAALRAVDSAMALQGGSLEIAAIAGEGTTVRLRLPAPAPAAAQVGATGEPTRADPVALPVG